MHLAILGRLQSTLGELWLTLEPLCVRTIDLWDGRCRTILGFEVVGAASQEHLWIRAIEHWRPTKLVEHDGLWWPPSEPLGGVHPEQGEEGARLVLGDLPSESQQAMLEDLEATLDWLQAQRKMQSRYTTQHRLEQAQQELEDLCRSLDSSWKRQSPANVVASARERFHKQLHERLALRLKSTVSENPCFTQNSYEARLDTELQGIQDQHLEALFYALSDIGTQAKANSIRLGHGCGALPGSLVAWLIGVTDVDPVAQGLLFERLLEGSAIVRRRIHLEASPERAEKLETWARSRCRGGVALVSVTPSPAIALLECIQHNAALRKHTTPSWCPDDPEVYKFIQAEGLNGYGLDPEGLEMNLVPVRPTEFRHLVAWTVLGHSRGLGEVVLRTYAERRWDRGPVPEQPEFLAQPLADTYGLLLYQEQVTKILCLATGCSQSEGERLRRAIASGNPLRMQEARYRFVNDGIGRSGSRQELEDAFALLESQSRWTFCQSQATARAALAYEFAWWRTHHQGVFETARLQLRMPIIPNRKD